MPDQLDALILDLLEWVADGARPQPEVMDAWRTNCPRLTVWEDAVERGYLVLERAPGRGVMVGLSEEGRRFLDSQRPQRPRPVAEPAPEQPRRPH